MVRQILLRRKAPPADAAPDAIQFDLSVCAQMDTVVVNLAEALPTFHTAVWARSCVQVHMVLELKFGGQLEVTDTAAVLTRMTRLCGKKEMVQLGFRYSIGVLKPE